MDLNCLKAGVVLAFVRQKRHRLVGQKITSCRRVIRRVLDNNALAAR